LVQIQMQDQNTIVSVGVFGNADDELLFALALVDVGHANHGSLPIPPIADAPRAPQVVTVIGDYNGVSPDPQSSSMYSEEPTIRIADPMGAQTAKDELSGLAETGSPTERIAESMVGYETSPAAFSVAAENNLSSSANSGQYQGNPLEGVMDSSTASATEGGFIAVDDGLSAGSRMATAGNVATQADLSNIDNGRLTIDVAPGSQNDARHVAGDQISSAMWSVTDAYMQGRPRAALPSSLDATEGGAIDLNDAMAADTASETADANDGNPALANADIRSESGVAQFCDMEVAVGSATSDESPAFAAPIGNANLPAAAQNEHPNQGVKPAQESAHRVDSRQRVSMGRVDTVPLIAGAAMLVLSKGVELEPSEREPKHRFFGIKR
jgi:hypothetical protein